MPRVSGRTSGLRVRKKGLQGELSSAIRGSIDERESNEENQ
jgi:hypothetical protein